MILYKRLSSWLGVVFSLIIGYFLEAKFVSVFILMYGLFLFSSIFNETEWFASFITVKFEVVLRWQGIFCRTLVSIKSFYKGDFWTLSLGPSVFSTFVLPNDIETSRFSSPSKFYNADFIFPLIFSMFWSRGIYEFDQKSCSVLCIFFERRDYKTWLFSRFFSTILDSDFFSFCFFISLRVFWRTSLLKVSL